MQKIIEEKIIIGEGGEWPLNGLLTLPGSNGESVTGSGYESIDGGEAEQQRESKAKPYPAVVLVHGSGASDMNSKVFKVEPFKDLAEGLAKHGVASIRYDKRTFVHGKKMVKTLGGDLTIWDETIEDAILAANMLRNDPRIDSNRIFIAGLSMGGMLAPRIDAEGGNFAGLIIMAGTPRRLEVVIKDQTEDFINNSRGLIKWIAKKQTKKLLAKCEALYEMSDEEAKKMNFINRHNKMYYLKDLGKKQVREYLEVCIKPVLVMQGDGDFHVSVEHDFEEYKRILQNHKDATFKLYEGLNHVFMPTVYGDINKAKKEYSKPQNVPDYVIEDIANWINSV